MLDIRPEDIGDGKMEQGSEGNTVIAMVDVTGAYGRETLVYLPKGEAQFIACADPASTAITDGVDIRWSLI